MPPSAPSATAPGDAPSDDDPLPTAADTGTLRPEDAERQAALVKGEDERLVDVRVAGKTRTVGSLVGPSRVKSAGSYTLVLPARRAAYTLDDLRRLAPQSFLLLADGSYLLREHILVEAQATLALSPIKPMTIRLASGPSGFVSIVTRGGRLRLLGSAVAPLTITSWDETANAPDTTLADGRAYLLAMGQLVVRHTKLVSLGFWSGRTGGLAIQGSGGPAAGKDLATEVLPVDTAGSSSASRQTEVLSAGDLPQTTDSIDTLAGEISDSEVDGNAFGLFASGVAGLKIHNVVLHRSLVDGLVLHRNVVDAMIDGVRVDHSGQAGIVITRGVEGAQLSRLTSSFNGVDGVVITGAALATGPSPSGGSIRQFGNNVLSSSVIEGNAAVGVRINGGLNVRLLGNSIKGGHQGILISHHADGVVLDANRILGAGSNGIQVRDATNIELTGNSIRDTPTGMHLTDTGKVQVSENTVSGASLHAVSVIRGASGVVVRNNTLGGRGSSAIDVSRISADQHPVLTPNDLGTWKRVLTRDGVLSTLSHPLTLVWIVIAALVFGTRPFIRRSDARRSPYLEVPLLTESRVSIQRDQAAAAPGVKDHLRLHELGIDA